ncbi:MAG: DUF1343 domain-containing protein [Actinomycetia bacterium]|nr:DUF1343 domain-containing protein [Actinomycetes bacterium]
MARRSIPIIAAAALSLTAACTGRADEALPSPGAAANSTAVDLAQTASPSVVTVPREAAPPPVRTGADVLVDDDLAMLHGRRVGLIANQTTTAQGRHLIDHLHDHPQVDLVAVFAPEHGVRGKAGAGELLDDSRDASTGVPVLSLYGETRRPTAEMLEDIDVLVFDIQDVGTRFYTYISTMGLAMQAAAEHDVDFVVLDRPNPLGGNIAAGFVLDADQQSFIGQYPIPAAYGLTAGELALAIQGERWLDDLDQLDLLVVAMEGWERDMNWLDTGLAWTAPSPGLPTFITALGYPGTVLFEATTLSYGGGTHRPFLTVGAPWADGEAAAAELNGRGLAGVEFRAVEFEPRPIRSSSVRGEGELHSGVRYSFTSIDDVEPVAVGLHVLEVFRDQALAADEELIDRPITFDLLAGTTRLRSDLEAGTTAHEIVAAWEAEAAAFAATRAPYLLYP